MPILLNTRTYSEFNKSFRAFTLNVVARMYVQLYIQSLEQFQLLYYEYIAFQSVYSQTVGFQSIIKAMTEKHCCAD